VLLEKFVGEFVATALRKPGVLLAGVEAERHRREDRKGRILADVIIRDSMAHLDGVIGGRVKRLQARNDFARRKQLNLKLVVGQFRNLLRKKLGGAVNRVQRFRKARGHAPLDLGRGLRDRRRGHGGGGGTYRGNFQKITTLHSGNSLLGLFFPDFLERYIQQRGIHVCRKRSGGGALTRKFAFGKHDNGMTALNKRKSHIFRKIGLRRRR